MLKYLSIIHYTFVGCAVLLPSLEGEHLDVMPTKTPNVSFKTSIVPKMVKCNILLLLNDNLKVR